MATVILGLSPFVPNPIMDHSSPVAEIQRWRRSVVRAWVVTMFAALAAWGAGAAWPLSLFVEVSASLMLVLLGGYAYWNMRRGRCPRCQERIRFEPRIELPAQCGGCGMSFRSAGK